MGPTSSIPILYLILSGASAVSFIVAPLVARHKGFAPYFWLFSGPLGLLVILGTRSAKTAETPEVLELMQARVNTTGAILSGVMVALALMLFVPAVLVGL